MARFRIGPDHGIGGVPGTPLGTWTNGRRTDTRLMVDCSAMKEPE
jgi:hypothetical protein